MEPAVKEIESQLLALTQKFLDETGAGKRKVNLDNSLQMHLGLCSLSRLELFFEIEKQFNIQFSDQSLSEINSLRDIAVIIKKGFPKRKDHLFSVPAKEKHSVDIKHAKTIVDLLLMYGKQNPERKHIFFQDENNNELIINYGQLLEKSMMIAQNLLEKSIQPGQKIAIMAPNSPDFFYAFFGILLVNCTPVPMEPLLSPKIYYSFAQQKLALLQEIKPSLLITFTEIKPLNILIYNLVPSIKEIVTTQSLLSNKGDQFDIPPTDHDLALISCTTDKIGQIRETQFTHRDLLSMIRSYGEEFQITSDDIAVSWAPVYRNPGLIGMWLECFYFGIPLVLMSPYQFFNHPEKWLWTIHYSNATLSIGDKFAYELCLQKITPAQIEGLNLDSWRLALNIENTVPDDIQDKFYNKFASYGFKRTSFQAVSGFLEPAIKPDKMTQLKDLAPQAYKALADSIKPSYIKSYFKFIFKAGFYYIAQLLKFIYTIYVALVFLVILPPAYLCSWFMPKKQYAILLHYWARLLFILILCPIKIENKEGLKAKHVVAFVSNHASYMDTLLFMAILPPETKIVAKHELSETPIISRVIRKLGHVLVDRAHFPEGARRSVEKIEGVLKEKSILIFPEGTFSYAAGLRPFRLGIFKIACENDIPIIPIATQGTRKLLRDKHYLMRPVKLKLFIGNPILPDGTKYENFITLMQKTRKSILARCGEPSLNSIVAARAFANVPLPTEEKG